ncbi:29721_t:CDS:2 [Gigaspora margarita]|uniref:29721_t:CDS:1 n=1 Tax=Gigaspora margarita TaxID=4874 RepID=A0ABN7UL31_GIGMA|nr:29721_t:CDS:2 [Gigaspora margarita]
MKKAISDESNKSLEILNHEEYHKKIVEQLNNFKEFDKKALKIDDFIYLINLIKELMNMNLKSTGASLNEINLVDKNDQLFKLIEDYAKVARKFKLFHEGLNIFNKNNDLVLFNIQEELLTEVDDIRKHLIKKSKELGNILYLNKEDIKKKIDKDLHRIIRLKSVYDLTTELECIRSRLKLFDPTFIQKISDFCEKLSYKLKLNKDLVEIFREGESFIKNYCWNRIAKNLSEIGCLVNNFYRHIITKTYDKIEFEGMEKR